MLKEKAGALAGQIWEALNGTEGLTQKEVEKRLKSGQVNIAKNESSKTYGQIFASNLLTFFNLINIFLFVLVLYLNSS